MNNLEILKKNKKSKKKDQMYIIQVIINPQILIITQSIFLMKNFHINKMTYVPKVGDVMKGEVVRILDFGAFVKITPNKDGLVHISEIKKERVNKVEDHLSIGDNVDVKIIKVDRDNGKISLSIKALL